MDNLTQKIYQKLVSRKKIMISDILVEIDKDFLPNMNNNQSSYYSNVIKIVNLLTQKINLKFPNSIVISKKNHKSIYLYIGVEDNPLESEFSTQNYSKSKHYFNFVEKSSSSIVDVWINYIQNQNVLMFSYSPDYLSKQDIIFHPQLLKEYNSRWYVLGQIENSDFYPNIIAIDSINSSIQILENKKYILGNNCQNYLNNMIGLHQISGQFLQEIFFQTNNNSIHNYLLANPLHFSQKELFSYDSSKGYGVFSIKIIPTQEFYSIVIQFFNQIKITSPNSIVSYFKELITNTLSNYQGQEILSSENFFKKN